LFFFLLPIRHSSERLFPLSEINNTATNLSYSNDMLPVKLSGSFHVRI
jgi:hypothetical protein